MCWQHPENQECYITYDSFKAPMGGNISSTLLGFFTFQTC